MNIPLVAFVRLRYSNTIFALFSISLGLLVWSSVSSMGSHVCRPCSGQVTDIPDSDQACSNFGLAAEELASAVHDHDDLENDHHGEQVASCGCDETHSGHCSDQSEQCECKLSGQTFPASYQRLRSTPPKRESNFPKNFPLSLKTSIINSTDPCFEPGFGPLRCHSPTALSNRPTAISGLGTQRLLC